ncbi:MAG: TonB-dependent receptor [Dysgonamonadaceae bacterium]|nr:TonB-dependent receptor [Dysgonamonadaceae bacterium]MDD3309542.1 TonB-dependent receptor [Dysgonamonadaceae bacterium]MDD3900920.1 TonB-dependent receptor [Dysgonamonadaceae bacterium]
MSKAHNFKFYFFVMFILFIPIMYVLPNEAITIKGKVIDEVHNETLPGVNVLVKNTNLGTITNIDGNYSIVVPSKESVLVFSFIGYETQEIVVGDQTTINVVLKEDAKTLDEIEVVAIAYSNQDKNLLTSSVSSITTDDLMKSPAANVTNLLAGTLPGVSTIQTSGQPGKDAASVFVRGSGSLYDSQSQPLILVDGVERGFSQIDPNEIESISILKDASSTAVFGVRGANGVVLVTTRRGKTGKPQINFSTSTALQQPISLVEQTGSYEFARFWNIKQQLDGIKDQKRYFTREQVEAYRTGSDPIMYPSIDWKDYIFNDLYLQTKNNVNISGGSDKVKYFVSLGYLYQNGLLKELPGQKYDNNYSYNRFNYRANIDAKLTGSTTMKLGIGGNYRKTQEPRSVVSGTGQDQNPWVIAQIWSHPFAGPGFIDGVRTRVPQDLVPLGEVLRDGMFVFYGKGYNLDHQTTLNLDLEITQDLNFITKGLSMSVKGAYDNNFGIFKTRTGGEVESQAVYYKSYFDTKGTMPATDPDYDKSLIFLPDGRDTPLSYSESYGRGQSWYIDGRIDYKRKFGDHDVSGLLLYNQSRDYYPGSYTYIPRSYIGMVGRVTYGYQKKYLMDINMGYNASENFAPGKNRFGLFPAFSAGWVASEEQFMSDQQAVDYLKFRVSWGRVGNDKGLNSRFMYMPAVWQNAGGYSFGVNTPENSPAFGISSVGNPNVSWETADKNNYGIDIKTLGNRLSFSLDYFTEKRKGILISPQSTPSIIATNLPNLNIGKVNNHGYEIVVEWNDRLGNDFNYFVNANLSFARNKIIFQDEVPKQYHYMNVTGGSTGRYTDVYQYIRLYQYTDFTEGENGKLILNSELPQPYQQVFPGDAMYADLNGDGVVDGNDKAVRGYSNRPEYMSGLNMGFNWKGLNFSMQWVGATNVSRMLDIEYRIPFTNAGKRGLLTYFYDGSWTPDNQLDAIYPRPAEESESWNSELSTLWLQDASYVRLKSLNFGYTFAANPYLKRLGISSLGLTLSGYNLLTFSPLKYIDPESNPNRFGDYPLTKLYNLGLNINF